MCIRDRCFSKAKYITAKDGVTVCVYDGEKYLFDESVKELTPKEEIEKVCKEFSLPSDKYCKPSIGETTRVLLDVYKRQELHLAQFHS